MATKEFAEAYNNLSPIQKQAVEWNDNSILVLAGPGSGKTRVLTCRIARLLDASRNKNFRILALTFTNKAADEMRSRVINYVPGQEGRLFLGTFHSFCADILRQHGIHIGINPNFQIYSQEKDLQAVLSEAIEKKAKLESDLISDVDKKTLPVIQRLKSLLVFPENSAKVFRDPEFGKKMFIIYDAYERQMSERNALDFNSLIIKTYQLFTSYPAFAKRYRTVYPYICIDEFQDTNHAQYNLIRAITEKEHKNLFIVADDDQIIYQWNGASHKRLEEFANDYSPAILQLPMNYRCPPEIVSLANNLIRNNFLRTSDKQPLEAFRVSVDKNTVRLLEPFSDYDDETSGVSADIQRFHSNELQHVVVLARNRRLLEGAERALKENGISAIISQRKEEFESTPIVWLQSILLLANDRKNQEALEGLCGAFSQLTSISINSEEIISLSEETDLGYLQLWINEVRRRTTQDEFAHITKQISKSLLESKDFLTFSNHAIEWFDSLSMQHRNSDDYSIVELFARYQEEKAVWKDLLREISQSMGNEVTLEAFLQELQMHSKEPMLKKDSVILMTIHGAKGKEFDHVYLIGLVEDELPSFQSKQKGNSSPEMEEERRNCFVAITRTIKTLTLSYAERYRGWPKKASRFLFEMGLLNK